MGIGARVRAVRTESGMSVAELAAASKLTKGFISQVESGKSNPSIGSLQRISDALHVPLSRLMSDAPVRSLRPGSDIPLRILNAADATVQESLMEPVVESMESSTLHVALAHGDALVGEATSGAGGEVVCSVLRGMVQVTAGQQQASVPAGTAAVWQARFGYRVECRRGTGCLLVVTIPNDSARPAVSAAITPSHQSTVDPAREGPFRLVAMRAERVGARRR
jgi:transcriptional regulator with XRE-family HTH domain